MNKFYFIVLMIFCTGISAQSKEDLKKENDKLKSNLLAKELQLKNITKEFENLKTNTNTKSSPISSDKKFQKILEDNNRVFFTDIFEKKYKSNEKYLTTTGLEKGEDLYKFENYNVVLANIINDETKSEEDVNLAKTVFNFNEKYITLNKLIDNNKDFFNIKYSDINANKYEKELDLIDLFGFNALNIDRDNLKIKIKEYQAKSCELREMLVNLKPLAVKFGNTDFKNKYSSLKKDYPFPYLQKVISDMSSNLASYTEDKLPECKKDNVKASAEKEAEIKKEPSQKLIEIE